ncbi:hypothetical protein [uncultured Roseobacter sp.]|uniref:hypothetical protein n=1 Tax=uncultured Roseobacter sp. TaxID=114847 RepID=UPI002616F7AE|nr:hypothetical protein [uncultured Roseobacter sp.]
MLLKSALPVALLLFGSVSFTADQVRADEHIVMILQSAYFPDLISVEMGDTVRFVNASGSTHTVGSSEGIWSTDMIADGAEVTLEIRQAMAGRFHGWTNSLIEGRLDLIRAPLPD